MLVSLRRVAKLLVVKRAAFKDPSLLPDILAALPEGLLLCTNEELANQILYANEAAEKMLPCMEGGLEGKPLKDCLSACFADSRIDEKLTEVIENKHSQTVQIESRQDGMIVWVSLRLIPLGKYFICRIDNMCDRQMNELKLAEAHKLEALGQLAGGVAHDFNNLLSIIEGYARVALKEIDDKEQIAEYLERIKQSVRRGAGLTQQLLAFGRKNIVRESVYDLGNMVLDHKALFKPLLDASVSLQLEAERDVYISCAPDTISQILMNVIINARDAMPEGGSIHIKVEECVDVKRPGTEQTGKYACISVQDTGVGMDADTLRRIYDPFFTTKVRGKGTGLGMSMVYGFVDQMGGFISIDSQLGKGTRVNLYFPISTDKKKRTVTRLDEQEGKIVRLDGYTALIAEDEPDLLEIVAKMLREMGLNVLTASNGNEALMCQEDYEGDIDFLVTDVVMPEMNGVKLAELFGSLRPTTKTLFVSGYPATGSMARFDLPEGANLLPKPVAYDQLAYVLRDLAEESTHEGLLRMAGEVLDDV